MIATRKGRNTGIMMNIFIDANVFLSFYDYSNDQLEELRKLAVLLGTRKVILLLPNQVVSEFQRNRDNKILAAMKKLKEQSGRKFALQFPRFYQDYPEYVELRRLQTDYDKVFTDLLEQANADIRGGKLKADLTIRSLFNQATEIQCNKDMIQRARLRVAAGNPPGKSGSLGDAINWEALLCAVDDGIDVHFITNDNDYWSPLDPTVFNRFLSDDWNVSKQSKIISYRTLSQFFAAEFPDILSAADLKREVLIRDLRKSASFAETHSIIANLNHIADFTPSQLNDLARTATSNHQVWGILSDCDVKMFLTRVIRGREETVDADDLRSLEARWAAGPNSEDIS